MSKKKEQNAITFTQQPVPFGEGKTLGIYKDEMDRIWFHGPDVARLLNYDRADNMYRMLDDENKGTHNVRGVNKGVNQQCVSISEAGFYQVVMLSRTECGKKLMKLVCEEILPSVRNTGTYISDTATVEDVKYAVENQLVNKCIRRARGETVKIPPMIEKLLELNSLETMRKTVLPYLNETLTEKAVKGAKDIMFDAVADTVKKWGNEKFLARKLDMPDQYMVMALLKECEEKRGIYLKSSRSQRVRRLIEKSDKHTGNPQ